jgi:hypothetical protein
MKMSEAAVVTGVATLAEEIYTPLLASREHPPAEPVIDKRMSVIDAVVKSTDDRTPVGEPDEPVEWSTPSDSNTTEPTGWRRIHLGPGDLDPPAAEPTRRKEVKGYALDTGSNEPKSPSSARGDHKISSSHDQPGQRNLDGDILPREQPPDPSSCL